MMKKEKVQRAFAESYLAIVLALLYLPILVIIVFSFTNSANFSFSNGFTLEAYASIFTSEKTPALLDALKNTFVLAIVSAVISTVLGTFATIGIFYLKPRLKKITLAVNQLPLVNSEIVMAVSLMVFFATFAFPQGWVRLIIAHVSFCTPYVVLSILPRLKQMNSNLYEAALDLGCKPFEALVKVIIPYISSGIVNGFVMAFTISMDDFIITQINKGQTGIETLSTFIYEDARLKSLEPFWFAVFSIIFIVVMTALLVVNVRKSKREEA